MMMCSSLLDLLHYRRVEWELKEQFQIHHPPKGLVYSFHFLLLFSMSPRGFLQITGMLPHQSTEMALERAANLIKVTHPPSCRHW